MYGGWFLEMFFIPSPQGSGSFPYVFFIIIHPSTLVTVGDMVFVVLGVLILRSDQQLPDGDTSLEVCLYPISAADLLEVPLSPCPWGTFRWPALGLYLLVLASAHVELLGPCVEPSSWLLLLLQFSSQLLLVYLFCILFMAHLGYLHFTTASLRCSNSSLRSSGVVHTVLALWVRVPMTMYLAAGL